MANPLGLGTFSRPCPRFPQPASGQTTAEKLVQLNLRQGNYWFNPIVIRDDTPEIPLFPDWDSSFDTDDEDDFEPNTQLRQSSAFNRGATVMNHPQPGG